MSKLIVTAPVLALAATAAPAYAQDMTWTGFYVGAHGGFVDPNADWKGSNIFQTVVDGGEGSLSVVPHNDPIDAHQSHSELGFGGQLGYIFQAGSFVIGAEERYCGRRQQFDVRRHAWREPEALTSR